MMNSMETLRKKEEGFTLVELAVVMIIIGLLIGGILKGQELIANSRVTATISAMESMGGAMDGFVDKYNALPGDMGNAVGRIANCAGSCANGNADGFINVVVGAGGGAGTEAEFFFGQLLFADFITGMTGAGGGGFGISFPTAPVGGGFEVGDGRAGAPGTFPAVRPRPHIVLKVNAGAAVAAATGAVSATQAATIDRRLDDGVPTSGVVLGDTAGTCATAGAGAIYNEALPAATCSLAYRL